MHLGQATLTSKTETQLKLNYKSKPKYRLQRRGAVDYYSDLSANESQQASSNPKIDYAIAASYNYLISKQELKAYQQSYQPEVQAKATEDSDKDILPSFTWLLQWLEEY